MNKDSERTDNTRTGELVVWNARNTHEKFNGLVYRLRDVEKCRLNGPLTEMLKM